MRAAPRARIGLALGAWGAVQATAAGIAVAAAGLVRDAVRFLPDGTAEAPYVAVFAIELILLSAALMAAVPLMREATRRRAAQG
jgi:BCD family chlorophyll transporter-like MFS transporter